MCIALADCAQSVFLTERLPQLDILLHFHLRKGCRQGIQKGAYALSFCLTIHLSQSATVVGLSLQQISSCFFFFDVSLNPTKLNFIFRFLLLEAIDSVRSFLENVLQDRCRARVVTIVSSHFQGMDVNTTLFVEAGGVIFVYLLSDSVEFSHELHQRPFRHQFNEPGSSMVANVTGSIICES